MKPAFMIMGTGSNVGKSMLVAGLCRAFTRRGLTVRPFKPQNMSNNAAVTADQGEIGRAQALQALACGIEPSVHMNPVLLKPESDTGAQVIVQGKRLTQAKARDYVAMKQTLMAAVQESFRTLENDAELLIVEGAGSPAEVNLRAGDIANMGFAMAAHVPVILAGDIDRGGVIAALVGTHNLLPDEETAQIKAFLINKFRGDASLFDDGMSIIAQKTNWPGLGIVPWFRDAHRLPAEDAVDLTQGRNAEATIRIAVPMLSRIANFDDLDPLKLEPDVTVTMVPPGTPLPRDADLVILPGTKSTRADLAFLRAQGWDIDLQAHIRQGGRVLGICGGYQMLGKLIDDPDGIEGPAGRCEGLGLLDIETVMTSEKRLERVTGIHPASQQAFDGYEIHIGRTDGPDCRRAWLEIGKKLEGARNQDGRISGCYIHGLFVSDGFRRAYLEELTGQQRAQQTYRTEVETVLDKLADHMEAHLDLDQIYQIACTRSTR